MIEFLQGDCRAVLKGIPAESVQCCVTSPPYWQLRDYGVEGQTGWESSPLEFVENLVAVFREVRRTLKPDGVAWLNLGDTYAGYWGDNYAHKPFGEDRTADESTPPNKPTPKWSDFGLKPKDLIGIPWRVALALQADGWYLRSEVIWEKPNPSPESIKSRPRRCHEHLFLLAKGYRHFYAPTEQCKSDVWEIPITGYKGAHFATFPERLIEPCILAGSREGDTILDPFAGSGTTGKVAKRLNRKSVLIELKPEYVKLAQGRCACLEL